MVWKQKNKNKNRNENEEKYRAALKGRKLPVLTLDNKWHKLFTQTDKTAEIETLSEKLNTLLKRQGKVNSESKSIHNLKKKLMKDIVSSMDALELHDTEKKMDDNRRLIEECNEKLEGYRDESAALPVEIEEVNNRLMLATMEICYDRLKKNTEEIKEINEWIAQTRDELKKKILKKQEDETVNHALYSYMHDIFGAEVLEIFDMEYAPAEEAAGENKEN